MKHRVLSATALLVAAAVVLNVQQASSAAGVKETLLTQGGIQPEPRGCTKKIVSSACTACSELGVLDNECKSGHDWKVCSSSFTECQNGAKCDASVGSEPCP